MLRIALDANTIISGLFFDGNERQLLVAGLSGKYHLVLSQDILEEVEAVVARKFSGDRDLDSALAFLYDIAMSSEFHQGACAPKDVRSAVRMVRDAEDAIHYAFVLASRPDYFVTGDGDFLSLVKIGKAPVVTTRKALGMIREGR
ncbi:MAG: putative toxin-antitoxin system toxin component, PIN family [Euryarchaeota archaeon]|nr:putative toxin-antitoxin system toxin component, PIN family [Euryarchaeota archaeon]